MIANEVALCGVTGKRNYSTARRTLSKAVVPVLSFGTDGFQRHSICRW